MGILDKNGKPLSSSDSSRTSSSSKVPPTSKPGVPKQSSDNLIQILVEWLIWLASVPFVFVSATLEQFLTPGSKGSQILGCFGFLFGTFMSADGVWQTFFQGTPLFPFFEQNWIGWFGWLKVPFNLFFWLSIFGSALIQIMEARTLRGKNPDQAKSEFENANQYDLPSQPSGKIDLTKALWGDYKRAGMKERHTGGAIALFFWTLDIVNTFSSRNPFQFTDPGEVLRCFAYNCVTMFAGEIGYAIWRQTKK